MKDTYELMKSKYGFCSSWAIWEQAGDTPKSNIGDLSILEPTEDLLRSLKPEIVIVGLNFSDREVNTPLANFHDPSPKATDFKLRYAIEYSPFCGAYMTDLIKNYKEKDSSKLMTYLSKNKDFLEENINVFKQELKDLGVKNKLIITLGKDVHKLMQKDFSNYKIMNVPHYASYMSKEKYNVYFREISNLYSGLPKDYDPYKDPDLMEFVEAFKNSGITTEDLKDGTFEIEKEKQGNLRIKEKKDN